MKQFVILAIVCALGVSRADVSHLHLSSNSEPHAPGNVDRQHTEVSDGSGVLHGAFSYVDPKNQVRTVQYGADANHTPGQAEQLANQQLLHATQQHFNAYDQIAAEHAAFGARQAQSANQQLIHATQQHFNAYDQIAAEHAAFGARQGTQNRY